MGGAVKKILVVDDDPVLGDLVADFCRQADFEVRTETDGAAALEAAKDWKPDLVTLDLEMPGMDGVEVLRRLRSDPETCGIPVVILSVVAQSAADRGLVSGAQKVFQKPVEFKKLLKDIDDLAAGLQAGPRAAFQAS
jgi:two-component system, OmpR family, response regulator